MLKMPVEISIDVEMDDIPVRGNVLASGDKAKDKAAEDEILRRLDAGDVWAWCFVRVKAKLGPFEGFDSLGSFSYRDEEDFMRDDYYRGMVKLAVEDLEEEMKRAVEKGKEAEALLSLRTFWEIQP